ncbi:DapH/DapD/GlmU-related protein [uncultured Novosphingobium sp.]|uniref:DapH/DapD/GlmU-related protein n=1 Tax=uncultured Novosphingobium sp. TaxID=292277 RepID=UPI00259542CC|nr:DapH/DapD/GlmU-related protein [uncultured Novosphingobium sp.]
MIKRALTRIAWYSRRFRLMVGGSRIGARTYVGSGVNFTDCRVNIGCDVFANKNLLVEGSGAVSIGNNVRIGPGVSIITSSHHLTEDSSRRASHELFTKPVTIAEGVWIGASVTILPGVKVGQGSVVAAGALVSKDIPPNVLVAGVPARVIRAFAQ